MGRLKNGENGKKNGTERNGMERTIKRNGTETERFFDAYCRYTSSLLVVDGACVVDVASSPGSPPRERTLIL